MFNLTLDHNIIRNVNIGGIGGQEKIIKTFFTNTNVIRSNSKMYDFIIDGIKVEIKKQGGGQWFDFSKYHNMSTEDRDILILFLMHNKGIITQIVGMQLGTFIDLVVADADFPEWTPFKMYLGFIEKKYSPRLEHKAPLNMKHFVKKYYDQFQIFFGDRPQNSTLKVPIKTSTLTNDEMYKDILGTIESLVQSCHDSSEKILNLLDIEPKDAHLAEIANHIESFIKYVSDMEMCKEIVNLVKINKALH